MAKLTRSLEAVYLTGYLSALRVWLAPWYVKKGNPLILSKSNIMDVARTKAAPKGNLLISLLICVSCIRLISELKKDWQEQQEVIGDKEQLC